MENLDNFIIEIPQERYSIKDPVTGRKWELRFTDEKGYGIYAVSNVPSEQIVTSFDWTGCREFRSADEVKRKTPGWEGYSCATTGLDDLPKATLVPSFDRPRGLLDGVDFGLGHGNGLEIYRKHGFGVLVNAPYNGEDANCALEEYSFTQLAEGSRRWNSYIASVDSHGRRRTIVLETNERIGPGEEVLCDYGRDYPVFEK